MVVILYYRRNFQGKRLRSRPLPPVLMSNIFDSTRYSELQSDDEDEDNEISKKEKTTEWFPSTKENPYHDDDEHIYDYAQPKY